MPPYHRSRSSMADRRERSSSSVDRAPSTIAQRIYSGLSSLHPFKVQKGNHSGGNRRYGYGNATWHEHAALAAGLISEQSETPQIAIAGIRKYQKYLAVLLSCVQTIADGEIYWYFRCEAERRHARSLMGSYEMFDTRGVLAAMEIGNSFQHAQAVFAESPN